jgi:hypothetical protein
MKLRFIEKVKGRDWKVGETRDFNEKDPVEMSYATKYVSRGWAEKVEAPAPAPKAAADKAGEKTGDSK